MPKQKTVLILATLDTKSVETLSLKSEIEKLGKRVLLMDISMRGGVDVKANYSPYDVATANGSNFNDILASKDRTRSTEIMIRGAISLASKLIKDGKIQGIISIGGSTGSLMATDVMRALPFGLPKLMISSTAAIPGMATRYIGTGDIVLMHSVVEISGINDILQNVIDRAAHAISGMVEATPVSEGKRKAKMVSMTMLGPCEKCASRVRTTLESSGIQVVGFSAAGIGDKAMEDMIAQGLFDGVIDLAPGAVLEHLVGGMKDAGPNRLESAGKRGIPQIISTCGLNHITIAKRDYTEEHLKRRKYDLDRFRTWLRASPEELTMAAKAFAQKLNSSKGKVRIVVPLKGWSSVDTKGNATYDPAQDLIFVNELKKLLNPEIEVKLIEANMEEPEFARAITEASLELFK